MYWHYYWALSDFGWVELVKRGQVLYSDAAHVTQFLCTHHCSYETKRKYLCTIDNGANYEISLTQNLRYTTASRHTF